MSSDEEDIHQCGRCKAVFYSVDEYFTHKKAKSCRKRQKSGPKVLFEDVNDDENSRGRSSTLNTPKYVPSSSNYYESFLEFVSLTSNDGFPQEGASKDGLLSRSSDFIGFSFNDSNNGAEADKQTRKGTKRKHISPSQKKVTGRPKKVVEMACTMCDFKVLYQKEMDKHMLAKHNISRYACQHCKDIFKNKSHLNDHLQVCFMKANQPSSSGGVQTAAENGNSRADDKQDNLKVQDFECQDCGEIFTSYVDIIKHIADVHKDISPGVCRFCGRWFPTKIKIFKHLTTETHPDISGTVMKLARTEISQLKIHWKVPKPSTGNITFSCKKCRTYFDRKQDLMVHNQQHHATEKSYRCENCGECFRTQRLYLTHRGTPGLHYFEDGFKCPTCGKNFNQKVHVCRHIDTLHTPLQQIPEELFPEFELDLLSNNNNDDDDEELYTCFVCCKQLVSQVKMLKHLQLHRVWCIRSAKGPLSYGMDLLFEKLYTQQQKSQSEVTNLNKPSLAVLLGMKPIQDGVEIPVVIPTSCEDGSNQNDEGEIMNNDEFIPATDQDSDTTGAKTHQNSSDTVDVVSNDVLPSMPLDLAGPSSVGSGDKDIGSYTTDDNSLPKGLNTESLTTTESPNPGTNSPENSTIDQTALRDLVEALETISSTHLGNQASGSNIEKTCEADMNSSEDLNQRLDALGGSNVTVPLSVQKTSTSEPTSQQVECTSQDIHNDAEDPKLSHDQSSITCPFCLRKFSSLRDSYHHKVKEHRLVAVFKCILPYCKKIFHSAREFENHSSEHSQFAFICRICNEHFSDFAQMYSHKSSAHRLLAKTSGGDDEKAQDGEDSPQKGFLCDKCGVTLPSKPMLSRHKLQHARFSELVCKQCNTVFKNKEHLRRHEKTQHTSERPFKCTHEGCNKAFSRKDKLRDHAKVHTDDKPYVCEYCSKAYRYKDGLRHHENTHQKELKYLCSMCESAFNKPAMLRAHMSAAHQYDLKQNYSYPCHQCGKVYNRPERLKRHMEKAHEKETSWKFNCSSCGKGFAGKVSYETHLRKCHPFDAVIHNEDDNSCQSSTGVNQATNPGPDNNQIPLLANQSGDVYDACRAMSTSVGPQLVLAGSQGTVMPIQLGILPQLSHNINPPSLVIQSDPQVILTGHHVPVVTSSSLNNTVPVPFQMFTSPLTSHVIQSAGNSSVQTASSVSSVPALSTVPCTSVSGLEHVPADFGSQGNLNLLSVTAASGSEMTSISTSKDMTLPVQIVIPTALMQSVSRSLPVADVPVITASSGTSTNTSWSNPMQNL